VRLFFWAARSYIFMKAVALLWDRLLVFSFGGKTQVETLALTEDASEALLLQLRGCPSKPTAFRLIYQPHDLVSEPVEVPFASRRKIKNALAHDHPSLAHNLVPWSCQHLIPSDKQGAQTLLNYEKAPRLSSLLEKITAAGFAVDGVFPLLTLLERLPAAHSPARSLVIAHTETHCLLYSREASGIRTTAVYSEDAETLALDYFCNSSLGAGQPAPAVEILYLAPKPWPFATYTAPTVPTVHPLDSFLTEAWQIPTADLSNFAPGSKLPTLNSLSLGLAGCLCAAAVFIATQHEINFRQRAADLNQKQKRHSELSAELRTLQERAAVIKKAELLFSDIGSSPAGLVPLLRTLEAKIPREITLTGIKIQERDFSLDFTLHVSSEKNGPLFSFLDVLYSNSAWTLTTPKPASATAGTFSLFGIFK
jgi:hypothetical protein